MSINDEIFSINIVGLIYKENVIEEITNNKIKNMNKIACGLDYLLILNDNNQCLYMNNKNKKEIKLLNEDIKGDIYDISSGDSLFFIITKLNSVQFFENLFENVKNFKMEEDDEIFNNSNSFDIMLSTNSDSLIKYYCHSYIFELFIDIDKLEKEENNKNANLKSFLIPSLKTEEILTLLEILYTANISWSNLNKDIDKYIQLSNISYTNLNKYTKHIKANIMKKSDK